MKPLLIVLGLAIMAGAEAHPALGPMIAQSVLGLSLFAVALLR